MTADSDTNAPYAAVLMIDQLSAPMIGPYGNTVVETPNLNRLAAQSGLHDFAFANAVRLDAAYDAISGVKAKRGDRHHPVEFFSQRGLPTTLVSDEARVLDHSFADAFDRVIPIGEIRSTRPHGKAAAKAADTQLANFFAQATAVIAELEPEGLCWMHSRGLSGSWDAPYAYRLHLCDDDDPAPPDFTDAPSQWIDPATVDPDFLLGFQQAAGAQVRLLDELLGIFLEQIDRVGVDLFCLSAPRGCPLGEHGLIGEGDQLYNESIHVPLMIRWPDHYGLSAARTSTFVQTDWIGRAMSQVSRESEPDPLAREMGVLVPDKRRDMVWLSSSEQEALQTHAWKIVRSKMGGTQLYSKPDDRWEVNDVSDRCPDIVEKMSQTLDLLLSEAGLRDDFQLSPALAFGLA